MIEVSPGAGPLLLEGPNLPSGSIVPSGAEIYATPLLDLTQPLSGMEIVPARPGYIPILTATTGTNTSFWEIESVAGAQTVPASYQAGNNAAHSNFISASTVTNADVNAAIPPCFAAQGGITGNPSPQLIANQPVFLDITVPASGTGGFKLMARLVFVVNWVSVEGKAI